jgi:hypothetical protein
MKETTFCHNANGIPSSPASGILDVKHFSSGRVFLWKPVIARYAFP